MLFVFFLGGGSIREISESILLLMIIFIIIYIIIRLYYIFTHYKNETLHTYSLVVRIDIPKHLL